MGKINVAELLKDCPKGMELDCINYNGVVTFEEIFNCPDYPIKISVKYDNEYFTHTLTKYGQTCKSPYNKCIIFPKGKTTWEGFQIPYINGDIVYTIGDSIAILGDRIGEHSVGFRSYCGLFNYEFDTDVVVSPERFATEEEKAELFNAIKANGYKWNEETKTLENLVEPKFKVGDKIKRIKTGNIYEIIKILSNCYIANYLGSDITILFNRQDEFELVPVEPKFKVGDKIKLKDGDEFGIITQVADCFYIINCKNHTHYWSIEKQDDWELVSNQLVKPKFKVGDRIILKDNPHNMPSIRIKAVTKSQYILENEGFLYIDSTEEKYVLEDRFDITTLTPFESRVLIRDNVKEKWHPGIWGYYDNDTYLTYPYKLIGVIARYCIPYEGNEHLLGTTYDCDEYFKTWK